jgi:alpha-beta hydrolase superfamily lysophospholipase
MEVRANIMTSEIELRIDVSDAAGLGEPAHVAATIMLPDPDGLAERPVVCFAKPASGYSRQYYTSDLPGPARGAQADFHAARGWIFVTLDTLGCASSSRHAAELIDFGAASRAAAAAEQEILLRLANGLLAPGYSPVSRPVTIGIGQSMGASLMVWQQARMASYDGIGLLGFSAVRSHPMTPPGADPLVVGWYPRDATLAACPQPLNHKALLAAVARGPQDAAWASLAWGFHYDDVAQDVVEQDLRHYEAIVHGRADAEDAGGAPWNNYVTPPRIARSTLTPGVVATEAAVVDVPVLCAMGERDLVPDPHGETRAFLSAPSVDVFVCPRMGHMHNFAGTRALFWERIHAFGEWCRVVKAAG